MARPFVGPNSVGHVINRQMGQNVHNFRKTIFRERLNVAKTLYKKDLISHFGCVNAIEFSEEGEWLISGGDDRRVLLWHLEEAIAGKSEPRAMEKQHESNIFCLGFNSNNTRIFSGGNDDMVNVHDVHTGSAVDVFLHAKPVYGLSIDRTNNQIFASAGEDGRVLVFDMRQGTEAMSLAKYRAPSHAVQFHPMDGNFVITANGKEGAAFWDLRQPKVPVFRYGADDAAENCMSVRFNTLGTQVLALRRRLPPILYNSYSPTPVCQFYHSDYYNSCTMKSCSFAGENDDYVLSGSDDFNLYVWKVSHSDSNKSNQWIDTHHMVLHGHRSIVNQVRYNAQKCIIASSGVEKLVKLWRPFETEDWKGSLVEDSADNLRDVFSHDEYASLLYASDHNMAHDYTQQNTTEDPRMMAFFDSLVQREIEGWNSSEDTDSDKSSQHSSDGSSRPTSPETSGSDSPNNFLTNGNGEPCRRPRLAVIPRTIYANRIAYLIATKRNTLKRLALRGAAQTERRVKSAKFGSRKMSARITRKGNGKRPGRLGLNCRKRSHDNHSDNDAPHKKVPSRRTMQHLNTSNYRLFRRKTKAPRVESPCTSDDVPSSSTERLRNIPSTSHSVSTNFNNTSSANVQCTDTKLTSSDDDGIDFNITNNAVPVPSTSTGITSNGHLFRLAQSHADSDDDPSPENSPRAIPVPINGSHHSLSVNNYSSGIDDERPNRYSSSRRRKTNISMNRNQNNFGHYSSHSNSRLSSSCSEDDDASSNDSLLPFFDNKKRKMAQNGNAEVEVVADENELTTSTHQSWLNFTPDSGISVVGGSSTSSAPPSTSRHDGNNNANGLRNNGDSSMKLFQQKVARVRRNYRNNFGDDSDSD
ncbi:DDB1- and CUL4-associated factor 5 [Bradysia coprophila]|uniref:DDB1- and CUL4-associated factor 5 n=1 Tax=Bradysia coprophila TaxID=38358 RepID=UPI00187DB629|nr:DDB1- and CUL4-associated factor 5 [Bradysia coprophila]